MLSQQNPLMSGEKPRLRNVVIVAPHFPPSNLAGVHRARLLSQHLEEFGWRPTILTTHWKHYEEQLDWNLAKLVDPSLEVISTGALPTRPIRLVGDIGVRALPFHLAALRRLQRAGKMDFLLLTVPSFYSAVLGELLYRKSPLPFGIDYIDPWVHVWPEALVKYSKAWASMKLGEMLEPWAVRHASLITAVAPGYYQGVVDRNPHLSETCVFAAMPYGFSMKDFDPKHQEGIAPSEFDPSDGLLHVVYAGALLPKAHRVLDRVIEGLAALKLSHPELAGRIRLHFIGTGKSPNDLAGYNVLPFAQRHGVPDLVTEHPHRMGYLDVLAHLGRANAILIVGSTEAHYTPSKVYQSVQSRHPVLAFLHEASTAVGVLERSGAGIALTLNETTLPRVEDVADALQRIVTMQFDPDYVDWSAFESYSARNSAKAMAEAMTTAADRWAGTRCSGNRGSAAVSDHAR